MTSVLQDWVMNLPLRAQGTILTSIRGCDLSEKSLAPAALEASLERRLVAWIRWCCLNPADPREVDFEPGCWFRSQLPEKIRFSAIHHFPLHWVGHVLHTIEVIAYAHPHPRIAKEARIVYEAWVSNLHLNPETYAQWSRRMNEDRIMKGTVVS